MPRSCSARSRIMAAEGTVTLIFVTFVHWIFKKGKKKSPVWMVANGSPPFACISSPPASSGPGKTVDFTQWERNSCWKEEMASLHTIPTHTGPWQGDCLKNTTTALGVSFYLQNSAHNHHLKSIIPSPCKGLTITSNIQLTGRHSQP